MKQWVVMGFDTHVQKAGLICVLPRNYTEEQARGVLYRFQNTPTPHDLITIGNNVSELWLEQVSNEDAWWN